MSAIQQREQKKLFGTDQRVVVLGIARMADGIGNSFLIVVLPLYIASQNISGEFLGLSESLVTGIILGSYSLVSSLFQPFTGHFSDRIGKRRVFVLAGLIIFMVANVAYIWAHSYFELLAIRLFQGLGGALTITATIALVSEISRSTSRGRNMGTYNSFRLVGFGIGPLVSGFLIEAGPYTLPVAGTVNGFVAAFGVAGLAAFVSAVLVAFLVRDPVETRPGTERLIFRFRSDDKNRYLDPIFALGIATFIMSTGFSLLAAIEPVINSRLSQGALLFSIEFSALIVIMALTQPFIGRASDRYGRKIFIVTGLLLLAPVLFIEGLVTTPLQMIVARAVQGFCASMIFAPALALAGDVAKKGQVGAQLSVLTVAFGLGISFGAVLSGYAIRFGFLAPFAIGALLALFGALIVQTQVPGIDQRSSGG